MADVGKYGRVEIGNTVVLTNIGKKNVTLAAYLQEDEFSDGRMVMLALKDGKWDSENL